MLQLDAMLMRDLLTIIAAPQSDLEMDGSCSAASGCFRGATYLPRHCGTLNESKKDPHPLSMLESYSQYYNPVIFTLHHHLYSHPSYGISKTIN